MQRRSEGRGGKSGNKLTTDGNWQTLISEVVPAGKLWRVARVKFLSRCWGEGDILIDEISVDNALTGAAENNVVCDQNPYRELTAGQKFEVKFKRNYGATSADITAIATMTTIDV